MLGSLHLLIRCWWRNSDFICCNTDTCARAVRVQYVCVRLCFLLCTPSTQVHSDLWHTHTKAASEKPCALPQSRNTRAQTPLKTAGVLGSFSQAGVVSRLPSWGYRRKTTPWVSTPKNSLPGGWGLGGSNPPGPLCKPWYPDSFLLGLSFFWKHPLAPSYFVGVMASMSRVKWILIENSRKSDTREVHGVPSPAQIFWVVVMLLLVQQNLWLNLFW